MCCVSGSPCLSVLWGPLLVSHGHHAAHTQRGEVPGCHRVHVLEGKLVWGFPGQVPAAPGHRTGGGGGRTEVTVLGSAGVCGSSGTSDLSSTPPPREHLAVCVGESVCLWRLCQALCVSAGFLWSGCMPRPCGAAVGWLWGDWGW